MKKIGRYWESNQLVHCTLCPHNCRIAEGERGKCGVRVNDKGRLYSQIYASCSSIAIDPIEKKPLFHYHPGSLVLSLGTAGCNFHCDYCQNETISQRRPEEIPLHDLLPGEAVRRVKKLSCDGISWTYNEPTIWWEYIYDSAKLAKKEHIFTSYVTNGFINEDPLTEIAPYLDAANIDIKAMTNEFYKKICGGRLDPVLNTCIRARELGIHLELTYLIIPAYNDSPRELKKFCEWVFDNLDGDIPVHFSAFYPQHKMTSVPPTPMKKMVEAYEIGKKQGLNYVYLGNVPHGDYENTRCPKCGQLLVERCGFSVNVTGLKKGRCKQCKNKIFLNIKEK